MNESWDQLCGRLKISGGTDPLCTDENLIDFEQESWISLPSGYREYCRRMGSGEIAGTLRIYCPCSVASLADLRRFPYSMGNFREDVEFAIAHSSPPIGIDQEKVPLL